MSRIGRVYALFCLQLGAQEHAKQAALRGISSDEFLLRLGIPGIGEVVKDRRKYVLVRVRRRRAGGGRPQPSPVDRLGNAVVSSAEAGYCGSMFGPDLIARTLSQETRTDRFGNSWQYHSRSDHHSKVGCWVLLFDLLLSCQLLRRHVADGIVGFGINHTMTDFVQDRRKDLDLVLCTRASGAHAESATTLSTMMESLSIRLSEQERRMFAELPVLRRTPVGAVLMALEAKAAMTAHQRALPRLFDELNSSHLTVHGATDQAIAAGLVMVNAAERYLSPDLNKKNRQTDPEWSTHRQPRDAGLTVAKVKQLPRRSGPGAVGYDALAIIVVEMANDGSSVRLMEADPAPQRGDIYAYASAVDRLAHLYATRFKDL